MTQLKFDTGRIKAAHSLVDLVRKSGVELKKKGHEYWGCCPFHNENTPSFSVFKKGNDEVYYCHGCNAGGDLIGYVQQFYGLSFPDACKRIAGNHADLVACNRAQGVNPSPHKKALDRQEQWQAERKLLMARQIYKESRTGVYGLSRYLTARGIDIEKIGGVPKSLRLHDHLDHKPSGKRMPAMVAPIQDFSGHFMGVHRTYLNSDYSKTIEKPAKMVLGNMRGGAIRLGPVSPHIMIAEGIETALSVKMFYPDVSVWAAVSLGNFLVLRLPPQVRRVTILGDNDMKPPKDGQKDPKDMMKDAALRIKNDLPGRHVILCWPDKGQDFNDMLEKIGGGHAQNS